MAKHSKKREYDLVVFGATSFVGEILCRRLVERGVDSWAMAARSPAKLEETAKSTGAQVDQIVANASDVEAMAKLAASAKVIVSTVGPYALYGSDLVKACAAAGTDYCDLTGEPQWIAKMVNAHEEAAKESGARIVNSCGFDSIPSDLGVLFTQQEAEKRFGEPCTQIAMRVKAMKGGASGGTIASGMNAFAESAADKELRKVLANPYSLAPKGMRRGVRQPNVTLPEKDDASGQWVAPFVMAAINVRIVHRSHALMERSWGKEFRYDEAMLTGSGPMGLAKASAIAGGLAGFAGLASIGPARSLLEKVLPKPGEGPSPEAQEDGFFDIRFFGTTANGDAIVTKVTGDQDPGYGSTSKMLASAALELVETHKSRSGGGLLTPATAFGIDFVDELVENAGLTFSVIDD